MDTHCQREVLEMTIKYKYKNNSNIRDLRWLQQDSSILLHFLFFLDCFLSYRSCDILYYFLLMFLFLFLHKVFSRQRPENRSSFGTVTNHKWCPNTNMIGGQRDIISMVTLTLNMMRIRKVRMNNFYAVFVGIKWWCFKYGVWWKKGGFAYISKQSGEW